MWPTEYMIHEHRKDLERTAAEIRLAREVNTQPNRWLTVILNFIRAVRFRLRRPQPMIAVRPQSAALRRVS